MIDKMIIPEAIDETLQLIPCERSRYFFRTLANRIGRRETGEGFVMSDELRQAGFAVEPFWETNGDIEGETYRDYRKKLPDFELAVRQGVFDRLVRAAKALPENWQIVLKAGFRPLEVQQATLAAFVQKSRHDHPDWDNDRHLAHARTFVSDPELVCPPHVTGGAIDIDVKDKETGECIDMGCPPNTDDTIAFLHSNLVTPEQHANRITLLDAMLSAGFAPNPHEWWHYQYGETYWAAFYGEPVTMYDVVMLG